MRIENPGRLLSACLLFSGLAVACAPAAQSQALPDLRGRNLGITGNFTASGTVLFGAINIASLLPPGGVVIGVSHPAQLSLAATGPADDSALTGSTAVGAFDETVNGVFYPGFKNPALPLTGSFNRTTGAFTLTGTLSGISVIDFGVHDASSAGLGIKRALIQFNNLGVTLSGVGSLDAAGAFTIKNPLSDTFTFTSNGSTPLLSLQDPSAQMFQTAGAYPISNASFQFRNTTAQAIVSGLVSLEAVPDLTQVSPYSPLGSFTFDFRAPGAGSPLFSLTAPLTTTAGSAQGGYFLTGIPFGTYDIAIKGAKNLRVVQPGVPVSGSVTVPNTSLPAGDANNDNSVDSTDFGLLIGEFNTMGSVAGSGYDPAEDFNFDGSVDSTDFGLLIGEFNNIGQ